MKILTVVATHNGMEFLPDLIKDLPEDHLIVDTNSNDPKVLNYLNKLDKKPVLIGPVGCIGAYKAAYETAPHYDGYFFMHDSMRIKDKNFLEAFSSIGPVVAWIGFPMDFDSGPQRQYLEYLYGDLNKDVPPTAIFGPIFYASKQAMQKAFDLIPNQTSSRDELCAMERGIAIAFHRAGFEIDYLEEYSNERLDILDDYKYFSKKRPNRE